jgi:subtilisin family serine protease
MVDKDQPDLVGQIDIIRNFVTGGSSSPENHGTAVAGIIVAKPNNGVGIVGIAPQARLMALRACWQERGPDTLTLCDDLSLAKALQFAIEHDAQIVNLSLSGPVGQLLSRLIDVAISRDIAVVAAYDRGATGGGFPASYKGVIAVVDEAPGALIPGAIAAPGRDVPTTEPGQRWQVVNGSSYAAAHVTGLLALLRQRTVLPHPAEALVVASLDNSVDACATLLQRSNAGGSGCAQLQEVLLSIATE